MKLLINHVDFRKVRFLALMISSPVFLLGSIFWIEGSNPNSLVFSSTYLGDAIFRLAYPLTFITIDLKILFLHDLNMKWVTIIQHLLTLALVYIQAFFYSMLIAGILNLYRVDNHFLRTNVP